MNRKLLRLFLALAATITALGASALAAEASSNQGYCDPLNGGCPYLSVSPSTVKAGHAVRVSGSVGSGCNKPGRVTIYSPAFRGATRHNFAGVPAIFSTTNRRGKFSTRVTIGRTIRPGRYHIGARCGGGNLGSATLRVKR